MPFEELLRWWFDDRHFGVPICGCRSIESLFVILNSGKHFFRNIHLAKSGGPLVAGPRTDHKKVFLVSDELDWLCWFCILIIII